MKRLAWQINDDYRHESQCCGNSLTYHCLSNARILMPMKKVILYGEPSAFLSAVIQNNDYDCVIMSHDQFGKIPQSEELQERILQEELDTVEENL